MVVVVDVRRFVGVVGKGRSKSNSAPPRRSALRPSSSSKKFPSPKKKVAQQSKLQNNSEYHEMPPYDSESSDEGDDYTETNVLLGYASKDSTGDAISHLGGTPV